jgi:hypothetical protein
VYRVLILGGQTSKILDQGTIEYLGPFGLQQLTLLISKIINSFSNGIITNYALYIILGIMSYLIYINSLNIIFTIPFLLVVLLIIAIGLIYLYYKKKNLESNVNLESNFNLSLLSFQLEMLFYKILTNKRYIIILICMILVIYFCCCYFDVLSLFTVQADTPEECRKATADLLRDYTALNKARAGNGYARAYIYNTYTSFYDNGGTLAQNDADLHHYLRYE